MPPVQGLQYYNQQMITMAESYDDFIMARTLKSYNFWHDRIPRGVYKNFSGMEQKTNIYRGGLMVQAGLSTWSEIGQSRKASGGDQGYDNCNPQTPQRYDYAWETITYKGLQDAWQSDPLCLNDLQFVEQAKDQVALIVRTGVDYGISMQENFNREVYVLQAMLSNRGMLMATGALGFEDDANYRFAYDPYTTMTDANGDSVPYITYPATTELSTLNWDFLDYLRTTLADRAGEAALSMDSGMPVFGLMIDLLDFEKMIKADADLRTDWRESMSHSSKLIEGYGMGMKMYRGFALIHDPRQMRFTPYQIDPSTGEMVATRVLPQRAGRAVTIGNVPEPNPAYYRAEIGIGVIFMNDVVQNLFVVQPKDLGSGTSFGPAPGMTGLWKWINIPDPVTNMLGESGFFYGRFQIFPKPLLFSTECTVFAYRRCAHALRTACAIQSSDDVGSGAIAIKADAVAADVDVTNNRVTLTLSELLGAGVGDAVTIKKADTNTFAARMISDALAPKYVFSWVDGTSNEPADENDFTAAVTTVTVA